MNLKLRALFFSLACIVGVYRAAAQDTTFTYQGRLLDNGANFNGVGQFKFALVTSVTSGSQATATPMMGGSSPHEFVEGFNIIAGGGGYTAAPLVTITGGGGSGASGQATISGEVVNGITIIDPGSGYTSAPTVTIAAPPDIAYTTYWSNDGTSSAGSEPTAAVAVNVTNGLFTVVLGDTTLANMTAISGSLFTQSNLQLQIWFSDGVNGFAGLSPAQNLTPTPYAAYALTAESALTAGTAASATSAATASAVAASAVNTAAIQNGAVTAAKIGSAQVVKSLASGASALYDNVTLAAGSNVTITPSGQTLTIAASGGGGGSPTFNNNQFFSDGTQTNLATNQTFNTITLNASNQTALLIPNNTNVALPLVQIGSTTPYTSVEAAIELGRLLTNNDSLDSHGFADNSEFTKTNLGYNSYDALAQIGTGSALLNINHVDAFQARYQLVGNLALGGCYGLNVYPQFNGSQVVLQSNIAVFIQPPVLSGGASTHIGNSYALYQQQQEIPNVIITNLYGIVLADSNQLSGFGTTNPTASVHINSSNGINALQIDLPGNAAAFLVDSNGATHGNGLGLTNLNAIMLPVDITTGSGSATHYFSPFETVSFAFGEATETNASFLLRGAHLFNSSRFNPGTTSVLAGTNCTFIWRTNGVNTGMSNCFGSTGITNFDSAFSTVDGEVIDLQIVVPANSTTIFRGGLYP